MKQTIGEWLRAARVTRGLSQLDLRERTKISNTTLSHYETNLRPITFPHAVILAEELGLDPTELVCRIIRSRLEQSDEGRAFLTEARAGRFYDEPFDQGSRSSN